MAFHQYVKVRTVIDLELKDKTDSLKEMTQTLCKAMGIRKQKAIVDDLLKREESASTFIGQGIAIPQARAAIKDEFAIAVGRSVSGIKYDAARGALAHIIVLVLVRDEDIDSGKQVSLLSEIASCFKSDIVREQILNTPGPVDVRSVVSSFDQRSVAQKKVRQQKKTVPAPVLRNAIALARDIKAEAVFVFADSVRDNDFLDKLRIRQKLIIATSNKARFDEKDRRIHAIIQAPPMLSERIGQIKIGILLGLSRNLISREDKVVCVCGNPKNGVFDTLVALDIGREYEFFFTETRSLLPPDVKPEVLERVLGIAGEIAVEGREGKPTGTIFVLGDTNTVNVYVRQLIINPFRGYSEAERNIMDPGLDETIKEFSSIDGAFVITGDGIVLSAGSFLRPQGEIEPLPSGYGSRHVAAAMITVCTKALAITISESTGTVTLFKEGTIMMSLSRPVMQSKKMPQKTQPTIH
ncbi:MAG: hypothetical protein GF401_04745 [Chitinivibrionales bacterium]|nr:hypothetical protein [Chitinivibrionales bacterium]